MFTLHTERLILRDYQPEDFELFYDANATAEETRFYSDRELDREFMRGIFEKILRQTAEPQRISYQLAICLPEGEYVGTVGIRMEDLENQQASYGCGIRRKFWKLGYAYEASRYMFEFGFAELPVHRLYAETNCENQNARTLAEKLGMRLEGRLRECRYFKDRWWSTCIYAILRGEWEKMRV